MTTVVSSAVRTGSVAGEPAPEAPVEVNERGFMINLSQWNPGVAWFLARRQGLVDWPRELTGDHWRVLHYMRAYYDATGNAPSLRYTCRALRLTKRQFSRLFPGGLMTARRISGLPGPRRAASRRELSKAQQLLTGNWWERLTQPGYQDDGAGRTSRALSASQVASLSSDAERVDGRWIALETSGWSPQPMIPASG
jgi:TusE/DsrC/DsvC family sulfur relay protein